MNFRGKRRHMPQLDSTNPPAPWRLKGSAAIQLQLVSTARARDLVPPELGIVCVAPGKTVGGLFIATYGAGSTLEYHELIVIPALVRKGLRVGAWISHIYVDDLQSVVGGRDIWALPKEMASFGQADDGSSIVRQSDRVLCVIHPAQPRAISRLPVLASVLSKRDGKVLWFKGRGKGHVGTSRGQVEIPRTSPFSSLGFGRGRRVVIEDLDMLLDAPFG